MLDAEQRGIDLVAHLQHVAAIDENDGARGEHDRGTGRTGEAGEPGEPLLGRRHILVLMAVGARNDETVEAAALQLGAQRREPFRARRAFAVILERLQAGLEHGAQSIERPGDGQLAGAMGCHENRQRDSALCIAT